MIVLVNRHSTKFQSVPTSLIARRFGLAEREHFEAPDEACRPVDVQF